MTNVTSLAALREPTQAMTASSVTAGFFDLQSFELMQRVAKGFASSTLVPQQYQGNVANTMIALSMAQRIGADPMAVLQNLHIIHGRPSWSSKFLIATFNACGRFTAMRFRFKGDEGKDDWSCQAYATERATGDEVAGSWVSIAIAKAEGWHSKNGSKWKTMPQQMLMYRAASFMVNIVAPELSMGLQTAEEAADVIDVSRQSDGGYAVTVEDLREPESPPSHESAAPEVDVPDWPRADAETGELVDVRGCPWIEAAHSANRTCNADGTWRMKRGSDPERVKQLESQAMADAQPPAQEESPDEASPPPIGFEQIKKGILLAADEEGINEWWQESQNVVVSQSQRYALEAVRDERRKQLQAGIGSSR